MIHLLWVALAIPIVIHLVHRRKAKQVPFSTLRFLQMVDQRVARRHRLKELLLLALRVLLLAALIGALYRPMVRSATFKGANVPTTAVIVLDNTCSMRTAAQGALRFDRAKQAAAQVLDGLKRGDAASLVLFDEPREAAPEATTAISRLRDELNAMECGYGTAEAAGALRQALAVLQNGTTPRKELYVISDFQKLSWTPALAELKDAFAPDVPVFLVDAGRPVGTNLTITQADFALNVQVAGASSDLLCSVRNTGNANAEEELALYVNGDKLAQTRVALATGAETTVAFSHVFAQTGQVAAEVRLAPDELEPDNARFLTFTVQQMLPVLLVNGDPSAVPHLNETFYLELALQSPSAGGPAVSPIQAKTVGEADFLKQRLEDHACVILANVPRLTPLAADRLRRYVLAGGGLIVFTGDRVDPASYNTALCAGAPAAEDLLPALLAEVRQSNRTGGDSGFRIRSLQGQHPLFRGVAQQIETGGARVQRFFSLAPAKGASESPALVELDAGPLLLERKAGSGTVILCTTAADLDWSNLPARRFFLPMLHQMVYYASHSAQRGDHVLVGMPYVLDLPPSDEPVEVTVYAPTKQEAQGKQAPVAVLRSEPAGGTNRVTFQATSRPGIYRAVYSLDGAEHVRPFAVNVESRESDPVRIAPEEAGRMLGAAAVKAVEGPERLALIVRREREGLPLWDYLFALAIAIAVTEGFVANVLLKE